MIAPSNPLIFFGWKTLVDLTNMSDVQLVETFENYTYSAKDVFISEEDHRFNPVYENDKIVKLLDVSSNESIEVIPYFVNEYNGLAHALYVEPGIISRKWDVHEGYMNQNSTLQVFLNNSIKYILQFTDPKLMIASMRPDPVPRLFHMIDTNSGNTVIFLKVVQNINLSLIIFFIVLLLSGNKT